ncbi:MAG: hypothetical protein OEX07_12380 [Gammaproteobacteria bacterium]|nr:hypothetical protein [Gammaproteobacteria bacterium]
MSKNTSSVNNLKAQYFGLSKTIRRVLLSGIFAAIYAVLDMAVIQPMMEEYSEVTKSISAVKAESKGFAAQLLNLQGTAGIDPSLSEKKQLEVATIKLGELEDSIKTATSNFVSPEQMSHFLSDLLKRSEKLSLISMENQNPDSIIVTTTKETKVVPENAIVNQAKRGQKPIVEEPKVEVVGEDKVYKHRVRLTLRGKYTDIANYLHEIEKMPWKLFWQELELQTETYPNSRVTLEIYTLSLKQDWLTL